MPTRSRDRYDTPWKRALQRYHFMAFFFRAYWQEIARLRSRPFRDKETARLGAGGRPHTLIADMLAGAVLRDGREVLLHIEVQSQRDPALAQRVRVAGGTQCVRLDHRSRKRLQRASVEQLAQWSEAVLDARTLKQVFSPRP